MINTRLIIALAALAALVSPLSAQTTTPAPIAEPANAETLFAEGLRFHHGDGVAQSFATAAEWFTHAAAAGHPGAQNFLGRYHHAGFGVARDQAQALRWLSAAAASGDPQFLHDLGGALENGADGSSDPAAAAEAYTKAAEQGFLPSIVSLGVLYQNGRGVEQDFTRAHSLYSQAAEQGNARAQNNLGLLYARGNGVEQDYARAAELFAKSSEQGMKQAHRNLGVMYENGFGVPIDEARAAELYRMGGQGSETASDKDSAHIPYDTRLQPLTDTPETRQRLVQAANAGDPVSQFQLGWLLANDPESDHAALRGAASLFSTSAAKGYGPAMTGLGLMHFQGRAVLQDFVLGQMWLTLAEAAGQENASALGLTQTKLMTPAQINQAQVLAADRLKR
ncbi:tetratricopeptide repeat protein [Alisedimentitalea sp. MJ-SS2]|uniref:tetratricopeptide repeat protein n=1 Tax=Aliisedimentitalea sp. MJ-SS2 TaxID=3049795 RepID=UPI0029159A09|nr:tetratricopeptide repeat protein [Alisedimentitalea sp. MJ-SS2]MDU8925808.1 tetratricopeptide repeat protein [Alisedimentitalea sp. MJ-SS2]